MNPTRGRLRGTVVALVLGGIVVPAIALLVLGMPVLQSLLLGAVGATVAAMVRFPPDGFDNAFPDPPVPVRDRGARREAFRLSWNVTGRNDLVGSTLVTRLRGIAEDRLAVKGLRLHEPSDRDQLIGLLGEVSYRLLTKPPGAEARTRDFQQALTAVESLADKEIR